MKGCTRFLMTLVVFIIVCSSLNEVQAATITVSIAETGDWKDTSNLPVFATTIFYEDRWAGKDRTLVAEHELLHAIGFTKHFTLFNKHVNTSDNWFYSDTSVEGWKGTVLAILLPATADSYNTHVNKTQTVNNHDQKYSIMVPYYEYMTIGGDPCTTMDGFEKDILNAAFDWSTKKIDIRQHFLWPLTPNQTTAVNTAVTNVEGLFGTGSGSHVIDWWVVPEPGTLALLGVGGLMLFRRRR